VNVRETLIAAAKYVDNPTHEVYGALCVCDVLMLDGTILESVPYKSRKRALKFFKDLYDPDKEKEWYEMWWGDSSDRRNQKARIIALLLAAEIAGSK